MMPFPGLALQIRRPKEFLHEHCQYVIRDGPCTGRLAMRIRVKQGCTLAPLLWVIYNYEWMMASLTLYADDTHACWVVNTRSDLQFMRMCIQRIYESVLTVRYETQSSKVGLCVGHHWYCRQAMGTRTHPQGQRQSQLEFWYAACTIVGPDAGSGQLPRGSSLIRQLRRSHPLSTHSGIQRCQAKATTCAALLQIPQPGGDVHIRAIAKAPVQIFREPIATSRRVNR